LDGVLEGRREIDTLRKAAGDRAADGAVDIQARLKLARTLARNGERDEATEQFVKYCGVSVEAFSRSVETYSMRDGESHEASDIKAQSRQRSKAFVSRAVPEEWHIVKKRRKYTAWVLLRVPKEEFDRIVAEKNVKLSMDVQFYHEDQEGKMRVMTEGTVLKSGDGYSIYVRASEYEAAQQAPYTVAEWVDFPEATFEFVEDEPEILPGVFLLPTPGHSPGLPPTYPMP
ncbi:MAG: DUF3102 domain-containing protein, partial [Planctomycetes bacterium]|nr:DUF3102 domain-containing protein [Planctomycetota bacterium]